jgi:hypothetical protein
VELIQCKFAETHSSFFHNGKNLGPKLEPSKFSDLRIDYDEEKKRLRVIWKDEIGWVPEVNVKIYVPGAPIRLADQVVHPMIAGITKAQVSDPTTTVQNPRVGAQVSTPTQHALAGPGAGKTGKDK